MSSAVSSPAPPWRSFLAWLALSAVLGLAAAIALNATARAFGRSPVSYQDLIDYQRAKAVAGPAPDVVFVGDSALGNAISARRWHEVTGQTVKNLALVGVAGLAGSLNMLERSIRVARPRNVVIVQTGEIYMLPAADRLVTADPADLGWIDRVRLQWRIGVGLAELRQSIVYLGASLLGGKVAPSPGAVMVDDYVKQGPAKAPAATGWDIARINPKAFQYLRDIVADCRGNGLNCLYVHGPLASPMCEASSAYFDDISARIRTAGLNVLSTRPICIAAGEMGDSENHVSPEAKQAYTDLYIALITPHLR